MDRGKRARYQDALLDEMDYGGGGTGTATNRDETATDYTPPNGNTGISGYGGNNTSIPPVTPPSAQTGPAPYGGGDAREWIMSLLGGGNTNERTLRDVAPLIDQAFGPGSVQLDRGDGTARGRLHNIPGYGMVTVIGDRQTWGDGGWAWRTGNEQFGTGPSPGYEPEGGGGQKFDDGGATVPSTTTPAAVSGVEQAFVDALLKLMNPTAASLSDPDLASQSQANRIGQQRSYERKRAAAAERAAATGTMGGAFDGQVDTLLSARGDAESAYDADLLAGKNDQNREGQLAALGPAFGLLGLNQSDEHFGMSIALQKALAEAGLNQQALISLLSGL